MPLTGLLFLQTFIHLLHANENDKDGINDILETVVFQQYQVGMLVMERKEFITNKDLLVISYLLNMEQMPNSIW